ncbi:MAG: CHAT domain-containing protein [Steroidobacteraceae bacterium]
MTRRFLALLLCLHALAGVSARAFDLPPACAKQAPYPDTTTPVAELRKKVEAIGESDPMEAVRILCTTLPRAARALGPASLDFAWWVQTLATPLIAYMDEFAEAVPLLQYVTPIYERQLGPNAPEIAEIHVAYGWIAFRRGHLAEAGDEWERALHIRERAPGAKQVELQKALVGLAQVRVAQRRFADARALLVRAQGILAQNGETISEAAGAIENTLTNIAMREEDYPAARRSAEAQLRIELALRAQRGPAQPVTAYTLYGQVLEKLDEYEEAEAALREAVRLAEATDGPLQRHYLTALTHLGALLGARGKPQQALPFAQRALTVGIQQLGPDAPKLAGVLTTLAEIERTLGKLPQALAHHERTGQLIAAHGADVERQVQVRHYRDLGLLQSQLGAADDARASLTTGLQVAGEDPALSTERAGVLLALALLDAATDATRARARLSQALALYAARLPAGHPTLLRVVNDLCGIDVRTQPATAPNCLDAQRRLAAAREVEPGLRHAVYANESALAEARGDGQAAWSLAVRALSAAATLGTPAPEWQAQYRLATLLRDRGDVALAIFFGKQAIDGIEKLRAGFTDDTRALQAGFLRDKVAVYRAVADWLMQAGRMDEGLQVLDLLKAQELYDFALRGEPRPVSRKERVALTEGERRLRTLYLRLLGADARAGAEIDALARRRDAGRISPRESSRLDQLLEGQDTTEADRAQRIDAFIASESGHEPAPSRRRISTQRLAHEMQRFGDDSAIGVYLMTEHHVRLLVATRAGQFEQVVDIDAPTLRGEIGRLLDAIGRKEDIRSRSRSLYDLLVRPLADAARQAGAKRLVLWPDDVLRYVPFAALHDGNRYLVEDFAIQMYADRGGQQFAPAAARTHLAVRALGVTRSVGGYQALPAVADELCYIVRGPITGLDAPGKACPAPAVGDGALPGQGFANAAFTEARLDGLLDGPHDFSVLHLGTHFNLRPGNALRSFLLLGDGGQLTLDRIRELDFSGIELATLSGCQTGMGGATTADGREIEGLSAIVQRRGAHSVIASLWRVEDQSTASLMHRLYDEMAAGTDVARALQLAQLSLLQLHPFYWAGFLLTDRSGQ